MWRPPYIERTADSAGIREAEVQVHAIEAIDEAITRSRTDLRATKQVVLADGTITKEPIMRMTPRDLAFLIDRLQVLFGRPSQISEGRTLGATVTSEVPVDVLKEIVDPTRGLGTLGPRPRLWPTVQAREAPRLKSCCLPSGVRIRPRRGGSRRRIVSTDWVAEMVRPRSQVPSEARRYGLGFWLHRTSDAVMLVGYDAGASFRTVYDPTSNLTHTVISNTSPGAWPMTRRLEALL